MARMDNLTTRQQELKKALQEFHATETAILYERPLWLIYRKLAPQGIRRVVEMKLLGGDGIKYSPTNVNHIFTVLASSLSLKTCVRGDEEIRYPKQHYCPIHYDTKFW